MAYNHKSRDFGNSRQCIVCLHDMANLISIRISKSTKALNQRHSDENNGNDDDSPCFVDGNIAEPTSSTVNDSCNMLDDAIFRDMNHKSTMLFQCAACNMIQYCTREHQVADWQVHKEFCDIMSMVKVTYHVKHPLLLLGRLDAKKMQLCAKDLKSLIYVCLKRPPTKLETELLTYPAYCAICYELHNLMPCVQCFGVSYCSKAHLTLDKERHKADCMKLRVSYCLYQLLPLQRDPYTDLHMRMANLQNSDLIEAVERATCITMPKDPTSSYASYRPFAHASSFSYIATICLGMSYLELNYVKDSTYTIFVVGATNEESLYFQNMHMKFFFLQNDKINKVELHFISPYAFETKGYNVQKYIFKHKMRTVTYKSFIGPFQQFIKRDERLPPSLIVAFNPDFSERADWQQSNTAQATWADGLQAIVQTHQVPIFITSPTKLDAKLDCASLLAAGYNSAPQIRCLRIFDLTKNPFADMRPFRNHRLSESETIYYKNNYIQGFLTML